MDHGGYVPACRFCAHLVGFRGNGRDTRTILSVLASARRSRLDNEYGKGMGVWSGIVALHGVNPPDLRDGRKWRWQKGAHQSNRYSKSLYRGASLTTTSIVCPVSNTFDDDDIDDSWLSIPA